MIARNGQTPKIWKHDATTVTGPQTHWNAWQGNKAVTAGPPAGVGHLGLCFEAFGTFRKTGVLFWGAKNQDPTI